MTQQTKPKLVLSFDIEATGDSPFNGSMVMLGVVAFLENAIPNQPDWILTERQWCITETTTLRSERCWSEFWLKHQDVWKFIQENQISASKAMTELDSWLKGLFAGHEERYWVALPAAYDWQWLNYYYEAYGPKDKCPIGFKARCIKGYEETVALMGDEALKSFKQATAIESMSHYALDDARVQGAAFLKARRWWANRKLTDT